MTRERTSRLWPLLLVGALTLTGAAAPPPAEAAKRAPATFFGTLAWDVSPYARSTKARRRELAHMHRAGVGAIRVTFAYGYPSSRLNAFLRDAARAHIHVLPNVNDATRWRLGVGPHHGSRPPRRFKAYAAYAGDLARRFGPHGALWRGRNRKLRRYAIRAWQIWNEPNLPVYWRPRPSPKAYARLVKLAAKAIRRHDHKAQIYTGGLPNSSQSKPLNYKRYLRAFLRAGGWRHVNGVAIHAYSHTVRDFRAQLTFARRLLNAHHGRRLKLIITEVGWADKGHRNPFMVGRRQPTLIRQAYRLALKLRRRWRLAAMYYFQWRDYRYRRGDPHGNTWGYHTGLLRYNGRPKRAYGVFRHIARHR